MVAGQSYGTVRYFDDESVNNLKPKGDDQKAGVEIIRKALQYPIRQITSNGIFKMVSDVDGRKPDSYKECWRWIRTLIQDFVHLKKVSSDYQKILSKVDHLFNQS